MDVRRATLVVNARSRSGERAFSQASELLESFGVPIEEAYALRDPSRLPETVRRAVSEGSGLIVLGGGDGSVSSVVDFLVESEAVLGLLPLGTANDFARTLGIPTDVRSACETIARGAVVDVDLGLAGEDYFVNVASVGLGVEVTRALSPALKRRTGALAYPIAATRAFFSHRPFSATLAFPNGDYPPASFGRLLQVAVGNGRFYGGGLAVAPGADIDDRSLDVYAIELGRRRDLLGVIRYLRSGEFIHREGVHYYSTRAVRIAADPPLPINIDGELVDRPPEVFSLAPEALNVLVPQGSKAAVRDASEERS
jgi:YegS/Rv2252/BmrU family lipid kinase